MLSKLIVEILQEKVMYVKVHHFSYVHIITTPKRRGMLSPYKGIVLR